MYIRDKNVLQNINKYYYITLPAADFKILPPSLLMLPRQFIFEVSNRCNTIFGKQTPTIIII